ncbi:vesicle transport through interaction with t-SNAREs 1 [Fistulifera solaris]|uniref:Vesicle transport through interaction with t-SNAREs 1 n=1 Tax=Fistulifera solaris TaxID=1519565 RepID=A0A1Z5KMH8_FISSO|nr:vesicle transport through interaction with t-SNAREs 1 [Fistulifera solaris]|eukprot:GAX27534.1 vesicle transport through interaction with t-SNAREs 1 [Fistulifera solaris]
MSGSYEDYEREYNAHLARIRSFLAGTRNRSTLSECDRLLQMAQQCATAMNGLAQVEGNAMRIRETAALTQRDLAPLKKEIQRALQATGRDELMGSVELQSSQNHYHDVEVLISSSDEMLRESQMLLAETEEIGTRTLHQMGRQREQLEHSRDSLQALQETANQAKRILMDMSRRAFRSRLALHAMIGMLILANLYVLRLIYQKHHPSKQP